MKCKFCPSHANYYMFEVKLLKGYFACLKHADPNNQPDADHPKDQRPSEVQSGDAAHRPED